MNPRLEELKSLWSKSLEQKITQAEAPALHALMQDPALLEEFSAWAAAQATGESSQALDDAASKRLEAKLRKGFRAYLRPWAKNWKLWAGGLAALALLGIGYSLMDSSEASPQWQEQEIKFVKAPEAGAPRALPAQEPQAEAAAEPSPAPLGMPPVASLPAAPGPAAKQGVQVVVDQASPGPVEVMVEDLSGHPLRSLYRGNLAKGKWSFAWNGASDAKLPLGPGKYLVKIQSNGDSQSREIELLARAP